MSAREALVFEVNNGMSVSEAAAAHGVARSCAYKWLARYENEGLAGLEERSRRPEFNPRRIAQKLVDELLKLKKRHPDYGPLKLVPMLETRHGEHVMAVSTAGQILTRHGWVDQRARSRRSPGPIDHSPFEVAGAGNTMTADFKGEFRLLDRTLCYPLTVADPFSRYVLGTRAMPSTHMEPARRSFERIFREHGCRDRWSPIGGRRSAAASRWVV